MTAAPRIAGLDLLRPVGRGGMGEVWAARDPATDRLVAVKLLPPLASPKAAARFKREIAAAARLAHPALASVYAAGEAEDGRPYYTMELVEGMTLREALSDRGAPALGPRAAVTLVARLARGLEHAHDRGVIHRDVKPANILIDERGDPRLVDFGLAAVDGWPRLTSEHHVVGTPSYMAPEVARGEVREPGAAADVWALGVVLYEALAGKLPFPGGKSFDEHVANLSSHVPAAPSSSAKAVDAALDRVVLRALDPALERRHPSCRDLALELEAWLAGVPPPPPRSSAGMAIVVGAMILAILAVGCLAILIGFKGEAARLPRDRPPQGEQ